ncbi:Dynein heavy chain, cytoplasmic [Frankliniella fusca]|uniref:Dynein heavy chain, cytoplasmic n=1 Tax=Frankliniella fusca TaxID=407009 RepID=A0AAE1L9I6_9NEOP|nr:Dynein heavy chain, cytoplasmic [Frankliniella fusca]
MCAFNDDDNNNDYLCSEVCAQRVRGSGRSCCRSSGFLPALPCMSSGAGAYANALAGWETLHGAVHNPSKHAQTPKAPKTPTYLDAALLAAALTSVGLKRKMSGTTKYQV